MTTAEYADWILHNGFIATQGGAFAKAIGLRAGRVQATGSDAEVLKLRGTSTRVTDLRGRTVIPGLIDSHTHLIRGGLNYNLELRWDGVTSLADALRMLREQVQRTPPGQWVRVVGGFAEMQFAEKRLPTLDELNAIAPDTPVFVLHLYDRALLNRAARGGTLLKYAQKGHRIFLMVMTAGDKGGSSDVRKWEQEQSAKQLRVERIFWGGYEDTAVPMGRELIQEIEQVVKEVQPHFIFSHFHDDTHQDHRHLAMSTITATRYTQNVLFYEGPTTQNFSPTVFVDIDQVLEEKVKSIEAHASQVKKTNIEGLSIVDVIRAGAHFRGIQGRVKNAEGFVPLRLFINIGT